MKAIIQIDGKDTEVEIPLEMYDEIVELSKPKKFEFDYSDSETYCVGPYCVNKKSSEDMFYSTHGRYRLTEEGADMSLARNKRANRLEALAEYLGGLREWVEGEENYCIEKYNGKYSESYYVNTYHPERVYMAKECAIEISRMINNNEYEL